MKTKITLLRENGKRIADNVILQGVDYIIKRGLTGNRGKGWTYQIKPHGTPYYKRNRWVYTFTVLFNNTSTRADLNRKWSDILEAIEAACKNTKFAKYPWQVTEEKDYVPVKLDVDDDKNNLPEDFKATDEAVQSWADLKTKIGEELLNDPEALATHPEFAHLYGLDPQIRTLLSAVQTAILSQGAQRDHCVCWGHAGCGKTTTLLALEQLLGPGAVLRLDATSTSRAGIEELFFEKYRNGDKWLPVPPIVYCEEVEKADENGLKVWLGALDDRGELRKMKYRQDKVRKVKVLFICTVNDKRKFDQMMGSDGTEAGALSSRCVTDIYFPRPNRDTLKRILQDRIDASGGRKTWIDPALDLGYALGYTDPRKFRSLLAGGDRLLDGSYQIDRLEIAKAYLEDHSKKKKTQDEQEISGTTVT